MMVRRLIAGTAAVLLACLLTTSTASAGEYPTPTVEVLGVSETRGTGGGTDVNVSAGGASRGTGASSNLPRTGDDSSLPLARTGVVLLAAGGLVVYAARKRSERDPDNALA